PTPINLPTYAFQHHPYWLTTATTPGNPTDLGLAQVEHPMLGALAEDPATGGLLFTSRWSLTTHPWLADHATADTALVDLLIRAGDETGTSHLGELVVEVPLSIPAEGGVHVRVSVSEPDESGRRTAQVHSRPDDAAPGEPFTRHASARLSAEAPAPDFDLTQWPPPGAVPIEDAAFHGWTQGTGLYAEVTLPDTAGDPDGYGLHPALLDACLHAAARLTGAERQLIVPVEWTDVHLHADGATALRVHLALDGQGSISMRLADVTGVPVGSVGAVVTRSFDGAETARPERPERPERHLYRVAWEQASMRWQGTSSGVVRVATADEVRAVAEAEPVPAVLALEMSGGDAIDADAVRALTGRVLDVVQAYLSAPRLQDTRLLAVTRGAVAVTADEALTDLPAAAAAGLLRSAQAEHPGRITLIDTDGSVPLTRLATPLPTLDEPQLAVRQGMSHVPRLTRTTPELDDRPLDPDGTILITGGTGTLGRLVAHHLITHHGARHLLLT
ncbi:SpnB-like Rossmann fold domain-containing protein, partial [Streptomyces viridochromogenes]|uniref:SpnB-like Rossmann fold domain-containing protein n=1 Tax=Streptomyces viridochromogenes TaxID=1938 RepID=UPI0006C2046D